MARYRIDQEGSVVSIELTELAGRQDELTGQRLDSSEIDTCLAHTHLRDPSPVKLNPRRR